MALTRTHNAMLNEYLTFDLLWEEQIKRNWFLSNIEHDMKWAGGTLPVPFVGGRASSVAVGKLTAEADISEYEFVRGTVTDYKEMTGTLMWHERDLKDHKTGKYSEQSFLDNLISQVDDFTLFMKEAASILMLDGNAYETLTADSTANNGVITVGRPGRFQLGQKVIVDDDNSTAQTGYVRSIDINTKQIVLYDARTGGAVVDFSSATGTEMTTAQNAKVFIDGAETAANSFTSLRNQLLSSANGGDSTIFGQTKTAYPYLQCPNIDGSGITASNIVEKLFDALRDIRILGKGGDKKCVVSYKHLASIMKVLESGSGAYRHIETKASPYGYTEVTIGGGDLGVLNVVGVLEMADDIIYFLDMSKIKFAGHQFFEKHTDPDGNHFYTVRATTGYKYITDIFFRGELICFGPCYQGIVHTISY